MDVKTEPSLHPECLPESSENVGDRDLNSEIIINNNKVCTKLENKNKLKVNKLNKYKINKLN